MESFSRESLVPDVIDAVPPVQLQVTYNGGTVTPGARLTPTEAQNQPKVSWEAEDGAFYTLIMNDPDAPSRTDKKFGEWHHWLVTNIPGNDISKGDVMSEYIGSGPPKGSGLHRYCLLVYKQPGRLGFAGISRLLSSSPEGRRCWRVRDFAGRYGLVPVAGNFFLAEWDEYVPILQERLWPKAAKN